VRKILGITASTTYTKHYYIGTERIASALGTMKNLGLLCEVVWPGDQTIITEMGAKTIAAGNALIADFFSFEKDLHLPEPYLYETYICADLDHHPENYDAYWYHPDHLAHVVFIVLSVREPPLSVWAARIILLI